MISPTYHFAVSRFHTIEFQMEYVLDLCVRRDRDSRSPANLQDNETYQNEQYTYNFDYRNNFVPLPNDGPLRPMYHYQPTSPNSCCSETFDHTLAQPRHTDYEAVHSPSIKSEPENSLRSESPARSAAAIPPVPLVPSVTSRRSGIKPTRPFKAYPKDPLTLASGIADSILGESNEAYAEYRKKMLEQVQAATGGSSGNKNMKRPVLAPRVSPTDQPSSSSTEGGPSENHGRNRDPAYWEKRRKNNEAAKRSRDARRAKEDEIAIRAAFLEQENIRLKYELASVRSEVNQLRSMIFQR